jgi:ribosomal protein S18 acetylase RimI-like enzyme
VKSDLRRGRAAGSMVAMVLVREVTPDDWETMRDVRLAALREEPFAFGSSYAREAAFTQEQWRGRINDRSVNYLAYRPESPEPAGLAGVYVADGVANVVSLWVRPSARGHGVGEALIGATADWAKARDHDSIVLWVTESNAPARKLYDRCGFALTGERQPLPSDPTLPEVRMRRPLG